VLQSKLWTMNSIVGIQKHYVIEVKTLSKVEMRVHLLQNSVHCSIGSTDLTKYIILFILCITTSVICIYQHMHMSFAKLQTIYEGWNFNSGNYLFTTDTK